MTNSSVLGKYDKNAKIILILLNNTIITLIGFSKGIFTARGFVICNHAAINPVAMRLVLTVSFTSRRINNLQIETTQCYHI